MINEQRLREVIQRTAEQWRDKNRELFSCFDQDKLWERIHAFSDLEPDADFNATLKKLTFGEPTRHNIMAQAISEEGPDQELMLANALELAFDRAFVTLWDRGALSNLIVLGEIPAKAQKDMQRITVRVEAAAPKPVVQTPPPPAPPADPVAQCVGDFHELGMQAFKKKYMGDTRMRVHFELATDRGLL